MFLMPVALVILGQAQPIASDIGAPKVDVAKKVVIEPIVTDWLRDHLRDYETARIEKLTEPYLGTIPRDAGVFNISKKQASVEYLFHCVRVNAKNAYGAYAGWTTYLLGEVSGQIAMVRESPAYWRPTGRYLEDGIVAKLCGAGSAVGDSGPPH